MDFVDAWLTKLFLFSVRFNNFKSDILIFDNKNVSFVFKNRVKAINVKIKYSYIAKQFRCNFVARFRGEISGRFARWKFALIHDFTVSTAPVQNIDDIITVKFEM